MDNAVPGSVAAGSAPGTSAPGLRRDAIGLREVLFQSITDMAPGAAIAASIPAGALYAGGALPLSVLLALVACLLSASCIGLLARELPSAGSLATYTARGLHPSLGFLTAWGYVLVGLLIAPLVLLQLGFTTASTINSDFHGYPANLWWPWSLAGAVIVLAAGFYGIRTSARLGTILGVTEIAVFLVLAVFFVVHAGHANTASVFTTKYTPKGFHGVSGVIAGSVYSVLAFGGFEGAAPLAEEARDPRRTIPRAVLLATLGIGALYVFTTYAASVAFGPSGFSGFGSSGPASWEGMARNLYGLFWFFVFLAIVNSTVANANAGFNVASRTGYAMGRIGAFPHFVAVVHRRHRSPVVAILITFAVTVAVTLGLGLAYNPTNAFAMVGTGIVIVLVAVYIVVNAACIGYFASASRRGPERRWNPLLHLIIPLAGIAAFVPAWLTSAGIRAFSFVSPLTAPSSYMGPGVAGFMFVGVIYLIYLYARHPERVTEVGLVHIDAPELEPVAEVDP
jgi:amino acid transporter